MLHGAMYWSGQHLCHALTHVMSSDTISACVGHEPVVGGIVFMWAVLLIVFWGVFAKAS